MKHTGLVGFVLLSSSTLGAGFFGCSAGVEREIGERAADGGFVEPEDTSSPTPTGTFNTSGDAGQKSGCPNPSPALFDFPGDGCDQDGDGKDGNESCDTGTTETGSAWDFAKALGLCQTTKETDAKWGVISALEENDIPIDYVTGSSMGALVGAMYASGLSPWQMDSLFQTDLYQLMAKGGTEDPYTWYFKQDAPDASLIKSRA